MPGTISFPAKFKIMAHRIDKYELVELQISAGTTSTRFFFPDLPKLRSKNITAIEAFPQQAVPYTAANVEVITANGLQASFVTFYTDGRQDLWRIPMISLVRMQYASFPHVFQLNTFVPQSITWEKSYIETATALIPAVDSVYLLGVHYS